MSGIASFFASLVPKDAREAVTKIAKAKTYFRIRDVTRSDS